jgi:hypothetical protein
MLRRFGTGNVCFGSHATVEATFDVKMDEDEIKSGFEFGSVDPQIFLFLFNDLTHFRSVSRQQSKGRVDVAAWEEVDVALLSFDLQAVKIEIRNDTQRFYFGPFESDVAIAFYDHDLVFPDSHPFDLFANYKERKQEYQAEGEEDERDEEVLGAEIEAKE